MRYAANQHDTLQHRHALLCGSDAVIGAAAYDSRRHHVCLYLTTRVVVALPLGASEMRTEHTLRLFSLKRELRKITLFSSLGKSKAPIAMQLWYVPSSDAYVAVYAQALSGILVLEPASLNVAFEFHGTAATTVVRGGMDTGDLLLVTRITGGKAPTMTAIEVWAIARPAAVAPLAVEPRGKLTSVVDEIAMVCANDQRAFGIAVPPATDSHPRSSLIVWDRASRQILKIHNGFDDGLFLCLVQLSGDWLFTTHAAGSLSIWNATFALSKLYTVGSPTPYRCLGGAPLPGQRVVDIVPVPVREVANTAEVEIDLFTVHADSAVQQFRFRVVAPSENVLDVRFDPLGRFDVAAVTPVTARGARAFGLPVQVDMGHSVEHLFLMAVQNTVHVLKVQSLAESLAVLDLQHTLGRLDALTTDADHTVAVAWAGDAALLFSFSPTAPAHLEHVLAPYESSAWVTSVKLDLTFLFVGFSTGVVQAYDLATGATCGRFQDPHLDTPVSALLALALPHSHVREGDATWGGKLRSKPRLGARPDLKAPMVLLAGTNDGWIYAWRTSAQSPRFQELQATWRWQAHVHHVQSLLSLRVDSKYHSVVSVAGFGDVKLWDALQLPTMLAQHDGGCPSRALVTATCVLQEHAKLHFLVCGFEDGSLQALEVVSQLHPIEATELATWDIRWRLLASLQPHERRVACVQNMPHPGRLPPPLNVLCNCVFASSSYDGHVIVWAVDTDAQTIVERRYFELYGPVLGVFAYLDGLVLGLPSEICRLQFVTCAEPVPVTVSPESPEEATEETPKRPTTPFNSHAVIVVPSIPRPPVEVPEAVPPIDVPPDTIQPIDELKDSLSVTERVVPSPLTKIGSVTQAIYDFAKTMYHDIGDDPSQQTLAQIHLAAGDLRRVYRVWQGLSPSPLRRVSGKEIAQYLRSHFWQLETPVYWQDIIDALYAFAAGPTAAPTHDRGPGYDAMGTTKALVTFNALGEKHVARVSLGCDRSAVPRGPVLPRVASHVVLPAAKPTVQRPVFLPATFRDNWPSDACWCDRELAMPTLTDPETDATSEAKCTDCRKRRHAVQPDDGFTVRGVVATIYHIYKNMHTERRHRTNVSLEHVTFLWFTQRYGMPAVVVHKLYWFLLSLARVEGSVAIARTFGTFLNIHDDAPPVPLRIVQLYLDGFDWLHARSLVERGAPLPGAEGVQPLELAFGERHSHWERVSVANCQACTQALLLYPKVPPQWVAHTLAGLPALDEGGSVEIHAFLSLWVDEWRASSMAYAAAERYLFAPTSHPAIADLDIAFRKYRVLLDCFVYCDRRRDGCVDSETFISIMSGLRNLWPPADVNVLDELHRLIERYHDHDHDGATCYLDLFALLYVVAIKTGMVLTFPEIREFACGYKLEMDASFEDHAVAYMQHKVFDAPPLGLQDSMAPKEAARRRLHEVSSDTFDWTHTVLRDRDVDVHLGDIALAIAGAATRDTAAVARVASHVPSARHTPATVLPPAPYVPSAPKDTGNAFVSALLLRELVDNTGPPTAAAAHSTATKVRRVKDAVAPMPPPTSTTLYVQFPDTAPYRIRTGVNLELPFTALAASMVINDASTVNDGVTCRSNASTSSGGLSMMASLPVEDILRQEGVRPTTVSTEAFEAIDEPEMPPVMPEPERVVAAPVQEVVPPIAVTELEEPVPDPVPPVESTSVDSDDTMMVLDATMAHDEVEPETVATMFMESESAADSQEEVAREPTFDVLEQAVNERFTIAEPELVVEDEVATNNPSLDSAEAVSEEASVDVSADDPPVLSEADLIDAALSSMQSELQALTVVDEPVKLAHRYPAVVTRVPELASTEVPPLGAYDIAYPFDAATRRLRLPPMQLTLRQDVEWEVTDMDKSEARDGFKPLDVVPRLLAFDAAFPFEPVAIDFTPLPSPEVSDDGGSSDGSNDESDDDSDDDADDDSDEDEDEDADEGNVVPREATSEQSRRGSSNNAIDDALNTAAPSDALNQHIEAEVARRRNHKVKSAVAVVDQAAPVATAAPAPTPRRTFLFSRPVELKAKVLYKKKTSVSWKPQDASDEEDADGDDRAASGSYDNSVFYGDRNASGDIVLSPRLESSIHHRWAEAFEAEEQSIHAQLEAMSPPPPVEVVSALQNVELTFSSTDMDKTRARIRRRTQRRLSVFRSERLLRERDCAATCLVLGDVWRGAVHPQQAVYFEYENKDPTAIVTFKMHCIEGEAELYASTTTQAPCSNDYDWRAKDLSDPGAAELHRAITVHPYDKLVKHNVFFVGVVGVSGAPCIVHLSAVSSGQSVATSDAMERVGHLISTFNSLANLVNHDLDKLRGSTDELAYAGLRGHYEAIARRASPNKQTIERMAQVFVADRGAGKGDEPKPIELESDVRGFQVLLERLVDFKDPLEPRGDNDDDGNFADDNEGLVDELTPVKESRRESSMALLMARQPRPSVDERQALRSSIQKMVADRLGDIVPPRRSSAVRDVATPEPVAYSLKLSRAKHQVIDKALDD
ncbi:hypothetical protein ACHHYP_01339 [Achlya hypogyna]|uniref:Uncharacterized protein n=1 Tax=Achlya hypogyna TaxID=1202772 RepID=A0A1V9ZTH4_ACHHY|nr:hypothetical protein ACHHYP_01339 [Achlya hypogyna]